MRVTFGHGVRPVALAAAVVLGAASVGSRPSAQEDQAEPLPSVTVTPVVRAAINPTYAFVGELQAVADIELRARVEGFLEERNFEEGQDVESGAVLFVIEKDSYESEVDRRKAEVEERKAQLALATATLQRREQAAKSGAVSQVDVDIAAAEKQVAAANVKDAQAALRKAELDLSYTDMVAPISGRIGRETYNVGNLVGPSSEPLANIVKLDPIYVNFSIAEAVYLDFQEERLEAADANSYKSQFTLKLPNGAQYAHEGEVDFVDNRVDPSTGTVAIRAVFPNPDKLLLPGQFATVQVQRKQVEELGLVIPQAAVQEDQAGTFVLVVGKDGTVENRRVTMGERVGINWEVKDGLADGELVIYQGIQKARPGGKVDAVVATPAEPTAGEGS